MPQDQADPRRPDPDALLGLMAGEGRGRLKIFLGASPGVGKTYAMLQGAHRVKADGVDVVIGLVETHDRAETMALIDGLEVLPRRRIDYQGRWLEEFDLDLALARKPGLIIVDELAHTNAPDCRHPKRWQDVDEVLAAGIDVWTALNIQHVESLADVVARITGVTVKETVPDRVLNGATDVVLVDITPDELIERLQDGKVYMPQTALRAIAHFFTPANLTALRELALRRTADRVDDQVTGFLKQRAIEGPWDTSDHILVAVGRDPDAAVVVRAAGRLAIRLNASWVAVHVELSGGDPADPATDRAIGAACQLAERLGATVYQLQGNDIVAEILKFARRDNVTQIVVGRAPLSGWRHWLHRGLADALVAQAGDIPVHVIGLGGRRPAPPAAGLLRRLPHFDRATIDLGAALIAVGAAVGLSEALSRWLKLPNLSMIFLLAVLSCAARFGLTSAIAASVLSFFAYNFFFIEPLYTLTVAEPHELLALTVFLIVAVLTGSLAGRVRDQAETVRRRADHTRLLYDLSQKLSSARTPDEVLWTAAAHVQQAQGGIALFFLPDESDARLALAWPPDTELSAGEQSAARWALTKREPAGWRTATLPTIRFQFRPLISPRGVVGVCGFAPKNPNEPLSQDDERALGAILDQTAIAIDRSLLIGEAVRAAALEDNERLRTTLLSSLSHDLRTPLAAITGSVTTLRQFGDQMDASGRADLLASIEEEAARLSRFVANLLDMSRIESGALSVSHDFVDVADSVRNAVERSRKAFPGLRIETSVARDLPFIRGDAGFLEQVLFNLIDNAQKYGGGAAAIVHARPEGADVVISVTDEGPGIKPADLERVFEKFYRGGRADGRQAGTGLGLSIARGLVEAMGGRITAQSPAVKRKGTRILMRFPAVEAREALPR